MSARILRGVAAFLAAGVLFLQGNSASAQTPGRLLTIFNRALVPANTGISTTTGGYDVDGYRYANVFVEWDQNAGTEGPVALSIGFSLDATGLQVAWRYRTFEENVVGPPDEQIMWVDGAHSWNGKKSSYVGRVPIMGPRLWVGVYNRDATLDRKVSVRVYLTP